MTSPLAQPPVMYWSPSRCRPGTPMDGILWSYESGRGYVTPENLPADAVRLVPADALKLAERRAGHCNGRELDPPCGYCESARQCERCELIAATMPKRAPASAALDGTPTTREDHGSVLARLAGVIATVMIREGATETNAYGQAAGIANAIADHPDLVALLAADTTPPAQEG